MRTKIGEKGFKLWLSAKETYNWAYGVERSWPCSQLAGNRLFVEFDSNGLVDLLVSGKYIYNINMGNLETIESNELNAIVADHINESLPENHCCKVLMNVNSNL